MNGNLAKAAFIAFGVFALMAISASTGARHHAASMATVREVKQEITEPVIDQVKTTAALPETNRQVQSQSLPVTEQNKDVKLDIHINVHKQEEAPVKEVTGIKLSAKEINAINEKINLAINAEPVKQAATKEQAAIEQAVKPDSVEKQADTHTTGSEVELKTQSLKAAAQPVKVAEETTATAAKTVKPASASVLLIPMLALIAAMVAVKHRKPGYLPESVEDKLEDMGYPASSSASSSWTGGPSRSMYGAV